MNLSKGTNSKPETFLGACRLDEVSLRQLTERDIPAAMDLKNAAGWNQTEADWRRFLTVYPDGCFAATYGELLVGTVVTAQYGAECAWISMMLVRPEFRRRGIGRRLMEQAIARAKTCSIIGLDATPYGRHLYAVLGFEECFQLQRMVSVSSCLHCPNKWSDGIGAAREMEHRALFELDRTVFGADRTALLNHLVAEFPEAVVLARRNGRITGACLSRRGSNFTQIGPVMAESLSEAQNLVLTAITHLAGQPAVMDVPCMHSEFSKWLESLGFVQQRPLWRMFYNGLRLVSDLPRLYAIAGPDLG